MTIGTPLPPVPRDGYERDVAVVRSQLDEATFAAAYVLAHDLAAPPDA